VGRAYPSNPLVGVGAIVFNGSRVLLVKRGSEPYRNVWSLPGGGVEVGETLEEAVKRELKEECGIEIEIVRLAAVLDSIQFDAEDRVRYHYVLVDFEADYAGGHLVSRSDASESRWCTIDSLESLEMTQGTRELIEEVARHRNITVS